MRAPVPENNRVCIVARAGPQSPFVEPTIPLGLAGSHGSFPNRAFNTGGAHHQNRRKTSRPSSNSSFENRLQYRTQPIPAQLPHPPQRVQRYKDKCVPYPPRESRLSVPP
jgi:hypothetical protein